MEYIDNALACSLEARRFFFCLFHVRSTHFFGISLSSRQTDILHHREMKVCRRSTSAKRTESFSRPNPGIIYGHDAIFKTTNAKYPFTHTDVRTISLPARQISFNFNNIFQNVRPNKVVEVFVSNQVIPLG
jgi:hypothetical protein